MLRWKVSDLFNRFIFALLNWQIQIPQSLLGAWPFFTRRCLRSSWPTMFEPEENTLPSIPNINVCWDPQATWQMLQLIFNFLHVIKPLEFFLSFILLSIICWIKYVPLEFELAHKSDQFHKKLSKRTGQPVVEDPSKYSSLLIQRRGDDLQMEPTLSYGS